MSHLDSGNLSLTTVQAKELNSPIYRHLVKTHKLEPIEKVITGILIELTRQATSILKTTYKALAETTRLSASDIYHCISSLHRKGIVQTKPDGDYFIVSFNPIPEEIEEIALAYKNAKLIKKLQKDVILLQEKDIIEKDQLFDLIYPLVGKIVMKKITEAFSALVNYINEKLNNTLNFQLWRWKIQAKMKGVPLSEIVIRESLPFYINEIFIIDKNSSILLGYASRKNEESADKDLVGSMLIAINDFIATSFKKKQGHVVDQIQYGENKIYIKDSPYFYGAVVTSGTPTLEFFNEFDNMMNEIHQSYKDDLKRFSGSMEELYGMENRLKAFIHERNALPDTKPKSLAKVKMLGVIISLLILYFIGSSIYTKITDNQLARRINEKITAGIPVHTYDIKLRVNHKKVTATGYASSFNIIVKISEVLQSFPEIKKTDNKILIVQFERIMSYEKSISDLQKQIELLQIEIVRAELEKLVIQFQLNRTDLTVDQQPKLKRAFELLKRYSSIYADIVAFSDNRGSFEDNKRLAENRIRMVAQYLTASGIEKTRISEMKFNPSLIQADPRLAKYQNERGVMLFARLRN